MICQIVRDSERGGFAGRRKLWFHMINNDLSPIPADNTGSTSVDQRGTDRSNAPLLKLKNKRIALLEDNPGNVAVISTILELSGAHVGLESWGTRTFSRLRGFLPMDLLLMDLMFPKGITGFDIFDQLREQSEFDGVPIVAVSAMDPSVAIPQAKLKGFAGFIAKPVDFDTFPLLLLKVCNREEVWQYQTYRR